jgi:preprotein translocase subunit SecF
MLRLLHGTSYDFIRLRKWTYGLSALFIIPGLVWILFGGFRYSVEFTGGTLMQLQFTQPPQAGDIRSALDAAGVHGAEVQQFGTERDYVVRAQDRGQVQRQAAGAVSVATEITNALKQKYGDTGFKIVRTEAVGPKVGGELRTHALYAILASFVVTLAYLAWRFEWRFGVAAVIATAHDILATLAFIKYADLEISLVVVGAILTMIGYSLNDTIIIFDRVRENLRKKRKESMYDTLNRSVNETLPRSILTHATTFATLLALAFLGGEVIRPFALVMLFGVVTGTFSSVYVAAPVLLAIERRWPRLASDRGGAGPRAHGDAARAERGQPAPARPAAASTRR